MSRRLGWILAFVVAGSLGHDARAAQAGRSVVPPHEVIRTAQGVEIYYFPYPNIPLFEVKLAFGFGTDHDPEGKSGLGLLTAAMLKKGVPGLSESGIATTLDNLAGGIEASVGEEETTVDAFGLVEHAPELISLLFQVVTQPEFPGAAFDRVRGAHIDGIMRLTDSAPALAEQASSLFVLNGTAKSRPGAGFLADVKRIQLSDVQERWRSGFRRDRLKVLVIGGQSRSEVLDLVTKQIERMPCPECGQPPPVEKKWGDPRFGVPKERVVLIDRPGISEAHVRLSFLAPARKHPDYYRLRIGQTVLSGTFFSRLNLELREKRALTYHASGSFDFGRKIGMFKLDSSTETARAGELIRETHRLLNEFRLRGVTERELRFAKRYMSGSFPLGLENAFTTAAVFFSGVLSGLPESFMDVYLPRLAEENRLGVAKALREHVRTEDGVMIVVGEGRKLRAVLQKEKIAFTERAAEEFL